MNSRTRIVSWVKSIDWIYLHTPIHTLTPSERERRGKMWITWWKPPAGVLAISVYDESHIERANILPPSANASQNLFFVFLSQDVHLMAKRLRNKISSRKYDLSATTLSLLLIGEWRTTKYICLRSQGQVATNIHASYFDKKKERNIYLSWCANIYSVYTVTCLLYEWTYATIYFALGWAAERREIVRQTVSVMERYIGGKNNALCTCYWVKEEMSLHH